MKYAVGLTRPIQAMRRVEADDHAIFGRIENEE